MQKRKSPPLLKLALLIAFIIFLTAIFNQFSERMYYSSTNWLLQIADSLIAIFAIAGAIMVFFKTIPEGRKAILRMFGLDEEEPKREKPASDESQQSKSIR